LKSKWVSPGLAFHPSLPILATLGAGDQIVRIWSVDVGNAAGMENLRRGVEPVIEDEKAGDLKKQAIYRIWPDYKVEPLIDRSVATVKADAARRSFDAAGDRITWAFDYQEGGEWEGQKIDERYSGIRLTIAWGTPKSSSLTRPCEKALNLEPIRDFC
jgi:hypothetical protein